MSLNATILGQAIAFVLFVIFCMKYIWPPLINIIEKRQKYIAESLASAEDAKKEVEIAKFKVINSLKQAKLEAQSIINQANEYKIKLINNTKLEMERDRKNFLAQIQMQIENERSILHEDLRKYIIELIILGSEKIIGCSINKKINNDIIDKMLTKL